MAVTITDHRIIVNEADATTGWTGTSSISLFTTDPTPIESTGELGATVGAVIFDGYVTITSDNWSDAVVYCWVFSRLTVGTTTSANGGLMVLLGDGTNRGAWKVAGSDLAAFRHDTGPVGWQCLALDTTVLPASPLSRAGAAASVNFAAITNVGTTANSLVAAPGMNPTYLFDIIRTLDISDTSFNNCALSITGGTTGDRGTFAEIAAADRSTGNQQAHGILRQLAVGSYGCQGPLRFGNATGSSDSWFHDTNAVLVFESRGFRTTLYKIFITDNGTGTTNFILTNCALIAPSGVGASFDSLTDTDVTAVTVTGTRIEGFTGGVGIGGGAGQIFTDCIFSNGGAVSVTSQPVDLTDSSVLTPTVAADASAVVWNVNTDPDGYLDAMTFTKGTNAHHAIQFGTTSPTSITIRDIDFSGFTNTVGNNAAPLYIKRTTGTVNITASGCSGITSSGYKSDGAIVIISTATRTIRVSVVTTAGVAVTGSNVFLAAASGGALPYQATVTISRTLTTATVTHTSHGLATNDQVLISDILNDPDDIGVHSITYIDANSYSFTSANSGTLTYTGDPTITSTFVFLKGLANTGADSNEISMSREIPSTQPVLGWARKSSSAPFYKTGSIAGDVSSSADTSFSAVMVLDE